jgi:hypothetical protein
MLHRGDRQYLLKQMALRSAVVKGTLGGYKISISGLDGFNTCSSVGGNSPYLPYINVEVANNTRAVSMWCNG